MCGIVGYIGGQQATPIILEGLKKLEYRGYDSAGIATLGDGVSAIRRSQGKLVNLENMLRDQPLAGTVGIGHTRWATHGVPNALVCGTLMDGMWRFGHVVALNPSPVGAAR